MSHQLLARNGRDIWSLSDSDGIRSHNHLVRKQTLSTIFEHFTLVWLNGWVFAYKVVVGSDHVAAIITSLQLYNYM